MLQITPCEIGDFDEIVQSANQCEDPVYRALGLWPLLWVGCVVMIPPAIAAIALRPEVSWICVVVLAVLATIGLMSWSTIWGALLLSAAVLLVFALVLAGLQQVLHSARTSRLKKEQRHLPVNL
ncbi:hypothetical protein ACWFOS_17090 [Gordonia terrae]